MGIVDGIKTLLDIYSPRVTSRLAVVACMLLGVGLLAQGLKTGSGLGAIPFVLLVWANHARFLPTLEGLLARHGWLMAAIPLSVLFARMVMSPPTAVDDLLRHIAKGFWPGGYQDMYVFTALPPADLYPAFDALVGHLALRIGRVNTMWLMQGLAFTAFALVFLKAARRVLHDNPMAAMLAVVALVLVLVIMSGRLFLARPEIFVTIWAFSAILVGGARGAIVWAIGGFVLGLGYWLAPLYYPAALLLPMRWKRRLLLFAVMCMCWALAWWLMSDGKLIEAVRWTLAQVGNRIPGLQVGENISIVNVLVLPPMLALVFASIWAAGREGVDNRLLLLAGFFLLSNQVRYGGIVAPLMALHVLSAMAPLRVNWPSASRSTAVAICSVTMALLAGSVPRYEDLPRFTLPDGAVVLTAFSQATYAMPFENAGRIRVTPAFEVGAAERDVQELVMALNRGSIDCGRVRNRGFTHVVESTLKGDAPDCMDLVSLQGNWRLWSVRR